MIRGVRQLADGAATPLDGVPAATAVAALLPSAFDTSLLAQYEAAKGATEGTWEPQLAAVTRATRLVTGALGINECSSVIRRLGR